MSAPNAGRQSPEPEKQTGKQGQDAPGSADSGDIGNAPTETHAQEVSEDTKLNSLEQPHWTARRCRAREGQQGG